MSTREMGIEEARAKLGDLVRDAQQHGIPAVITRNGKRAAFIVPVRDFAGVAALLHRHCDLRGDELTAHLAEEHDIHFMASDIREHPGRPVAVHREHHPGIPDQPHELFAGDPS